MAEETKKEEVKEIKNEDTKIEDKVETVKEEKVENTREEKSTKREEYKDNRENKREYRRDNRDSRDNNYRDNREGRDDYRFKRMRRKICLLCKEKNYVLDYKDEETLKRFINEKGKILPRRATGTCAKHQREIAKVVKRARHIAVLPYTTD